MQKGCVVFSIDIETRGQGQISHGIISIGVCVGSATEDKVLDKIRFDMAPYPGQTMEQRCYDEFWSKCTDQFNALTANSAPPMKETRRFREYLDTWDSEHNVYSVCDNPGFDFGMINCYLDRADLPTLNYKRESDGTISYRNNHDVDSYTRAMLRQGFDDPWMSNARLIKELGFTWLDPSDHDHMPENDAEFIYRLHYWTVYYNISEIGKFMKPETK